MMIMKKVRILMMKRFSIGKKVSGAVALVSALVMGVTPMTAFAQANPEVEEVEVKESVSDNNIDASADTVVETEIPYSYRVNEDGSIVFSFNGEEYTYGAEEEPTGTVVTGGSRLNVRTGAGMDYEVIDQLCPGEEVSVIGTEGDWYQITVPAKTGYVHSDYLEVLENATNETDVALLQMFMMMFMDSMNEAANSDYAFTPDGNMNLIDDYGTRSGAGKQFITLTTKNGNYFYLIIDRDDNGTETVHFLNLVDESDLLSLMDEEEAKKYTDSTTDNAEPTVTPDEEAPEEPTSEPVEEPVEEPAKEKKSSTGVMALILIAAVGGIGAYLYMKKGKSKDNNADPDPDFDYNEDEDDYLAGLDEDDDIIEETVDEEE